MMEAGGLLMVMERRALIGTLRCYNWDMNKIEDHNNYLNLASMIHPSILTNSSRL